MNITRKQLRSLISESINSVVGTIPFDENSIFTMEGEINHSLSSYIQKNESVFISFNSIVFYVEIIY